LESQLEALLKELQPTEKLFRLDMKAEI